jgi:hypothetical protein
MATHREDSADRPRQVRKSVTVDADKLARLRKLLGAPSDAEALRLAVDRVLLDFEGSEEEE